VAAKRAIFVAPFDELVEPRLLAELAQRAEANGWDGFFLWDHLQYRPPVRAVADPWIALSAIAYATERIRLGPLVTPISRRNVGKLARETITLDHLSNGRLTLGVGLGSDNTGEIERFGLPADPRERARLLDEGLESLDDYWSGGLEPLPIQRPRIPVWVAARWPKRKPVRRAARWDGLFPIEMTGPDDLAALAAEVRELRGSNADPAHPFDLLAEIAPGGDPAPWEEAGATWVLTSWDSQPREVDVRAAIDAGP
jgi:alkanesulfonate monooxygenase SsuD/methylene tetrahydromethanopterin reductase-like flavin-dependent oxidoreductase (luciferase family)